eukprot:scaffold28018_cov70-Phaeocystis_antarctica.AAC.5
MEREEVAATARWLQAECNGASSCTSVSMDHTCLCACTSTVMGAASQRRSLCECSRVVHVGMTPPPKARSYHSTRRRCGTARRR